MEPEQKDGAEDGPEDDAYIRKLLETNPLREATLRAAIDALELPRRSNGLDVGCGIGLPTLLLAEATGPDGHITGLDVAPRFLEHGRKIAEQAGLAEQISFEHGSATELPFHDDAFDWAWSADCVGYGPWEPLPPLREMARVVRPGGKVAILAWSSEQLLPGYPRLEAHLEATAAGLAPFRSGQAPGRHFLRALGWFRELALEEPRALTFAGGAHAPLSDDLRAALAAMFEMRWVGAEKDLSALEAAEFERLCKPESPDFLIDHPDYYAFFTYSLFSGRVAKAV